MFRKHSIGLALLAVCCAPQVLAAEAARFSDPIPVLSDTEQAGRDNTNTAATHFIFFRHPVPSQGSKNFVRQQAEAERGVEGGYFDFEIDGFPYVVSDIAATPGALPKDVDERDFKNMLAPVGAGAFDPLHGFCPNPLHVLLPAQPAAPGQQPNQPFEATLRVDCQLNHELFDRNGVRSAENFYNRQLQIADFRSSPQADLLALLGGDPLVDGVLGSSQESVSPYNPNTYPATVIGDKPFQWPLLRDFDPAPAEVEEVIAYAASDIGRAGLVTVSYDPLTLNLLAGARLEMPAAVVRNNPNVPGQLGVDIPLLNLAMPYLSPTIFYRKDFDAAPEDVGSGKIKLAGYSTFHFLDFDFQKFVRQGALELVQELYTALFSFNAYPIAVQKFDAKSFAVVNSGTLGRAQDYVMINGRPLVSFPIQGVFPGGEQAEPQGALASKAVQWADVFGILNPAGVFESLAAHPEILPHQALAHVSFWKDQKGWGSDPRIEFNNPNDAFAPQYVALIGSGAMSASAAMDGKFPVLLVPSGESVDLEQPVYGVYKINPARKHLYAWGLGNNSMDTGILLPEWYKVEVPEGFAPYAVVGGEFGGDDCSDMILTFRGANTVALDHRHPEEDVVYVEAGRELQDLADGKAAMFAPVAYVYFGQEMPDNRACGFAAAPDRILRPSPGLDAAPALGEAPVLPQIASVAVADFDGDGDSNDVLLGDVVPRIIPDGPQKDNSTAFAYLIKDLNQADTGEAIRVGFSVIEEQGSLVDALTEQGLFGVAELKADPHEGGAHIGSLMGLPLSKAGMGCAVKDGPAVVASPFELIASEAQDRDADAQGLPPSFSPFGELIPQRCRENNICEKMIGNKRYQLPFWADEACCADPCQPECARFLVQQNLAWQDIMIGPDGECVVPGDPQDPNVGRNPNACRVFAFVDHNGVQQRIEFAEDAPDVCCQDPCGRLPDGGRFPREECALAAHAGDAARVNGPLLAEACRDEPNAPLNCPREWHGIMLPDGGNPNCCADPCSNDWCADELFRPEPGVDEQQRRELVDRVRAECGFPPIDWGNRADNNTWQPDRVYSSRSNFIAKADELIPAQVVQERAISQENIQSAPQAKPTLQEPKPAFAVPDAKNIQPLQGGAPLGGNISSSAVQPQQNISKAGAFVPRLAGGIQGNVVEPEPHMMDAQACAQENAGDQNAQALCAVGRNLNNGLFGVFSDDQGVMGQMFKGGFQVLAPLFQGLDLHQLGQGVLPPEMEPQNLGDVNAAGALARQAVRLPPIPKGSLMPGRRELTVVVNKALPGVEACNMEAAQLPPGKECNLNPLNVCDNPNDLCLADCMCHHDCNAGPLQAPEECNNDNPCQGGNICDNNCQCVPPQIIREGGGGGNPPNPLASANLNNSCECHASGFSTAAAKGAYAGYNKDFREATGINSDLWAEPEFSVMNCVCVVGSASAPNVAAANLGVDFSFAGAPMGNGNILPYVVVQASGSLKPADYDTMKWRPDEKYVLPVPVVLVSSAGAAAQGNIALPVDFAVAAPELAQAVPTDANVNITPGVEGTMVTEVSRAFRHVVMSAMPGSLIQFQGSVVQLPDLALANNLPNTGATVHQFSYRIPPDYASFTGLEHGPAESRKDRYIENRKRDGAVVLAKAKAICEAKVAAGTPCKLGDLDLSNEWEPEMTFSVSIVENTFAAAGEQPGVAKVTAKWLGNHPVGASAAHSCGCNTAAQAPSAAEALAQALAFISVLAVWRRLRKSTPPL